MCNITNSKTLTHFVIVYVQHHKTLNHFCDMHKEWWNSYNVNMHTQKIKN